VADNDPAEIPFDGQAFLDTYSEVASRYGTIPKGLYEALRPQLLAGAERARAYVRAHLVGKNG
jgi:hypothetical protein